MTTYVAVSNPTDYAIIAKLDDYRANRSKNKNLGMRQLLRIKGTAVHGFVHHVAVMMSFAAFVCLLDLVFGIDLGVNNAIISSLTIVLGLLLVFRTNTAYDRFYEGCKLWTQLTVASRQMTRMLWLGMTDDVIPESKEQVVAVFNLIRAFSVALKHRVRREHGVKYHDMLKLLPHEYLEAYNDPNNPVYGDYTRERSRLLADMDSVENFPLEITLKLTQYTNNISEDPKVNRMVVSALESGIAIFVDLLAHMDRIRGTPIPLAYLIHMKQAMTAYCCLLPFTMVDQLGWLTVPIVGLVAFTMFGIDGIGNEIENPFGEELDDLPLDYYCYVIETEAMYVMDKIPRRATNSQILALAD